METRRPESPLVLFCGVALDLVPGRDVVVRDRYYGLRTARVRLWTRLGGRDHEMLGGVRQLEDPVPMAVFGGSPRVIMCAGQAKVASVVQIARPGVDALACWTLRVSGVAGS